MLARADRVGQVRGRTVGVLLPLTGKYKAFGEAVMRGIRLALKGSDVELVVKDTQGRRDPARRRRSRSWSSTTARWRPSARCSSRTASARRWSRRTSGCRSLTLTRSEDVTDIGPFVFRNMLTYSAQTQALVGLGVEASWATRASRCSTRTRPYGVEMTNDFWDDGRRPGRGDARRRELHLGPDHLHHPGQEAGRAVLPRGSARLLRGGPGGRRKDVKDSYRRRKAVEKAKSELEPIVDFEALFIPDEWQRVGAGGAGAGGGGHHHQHLRPEGSREAQEDHREDGHPDGDPARRATAGTRRRTPTGFRSWSSAAGSSCSAASSWTASTRTAAARRRSGSSGCSARRTRTTRPPCSTRSASTRRGCCGSSSTSRPRRWTVRRCATGSRRSKDFEGATGKTSFNDQARGGEAAVLPHHRPEGDPGDPAERSGSAS